MIRKIWLRNWKAYDSLELAFEAGTTFLIAENGIGKSSIVQGLYFALFGSTTMFGTDRPVSNAVRGTEDQKAVAGCEVSFGARLVSLERTVEKLSNTVRISKIEIDGQRSSERDWLELLHAETGVDAAQLALLAFVYEGATISLDDAGLGTVEMLAEVFGVGRLRRAAQECELTAKRLDRESDSLRKSLRDDPSKRDADQVADLEIFLTDTIGRLEELQRQQRLLKQHESAAQEWAHFHREQSSFQRTHDSYKKHVSDLIIRMDGFLDSSYPMGGSFTRRDLSGMATMLSDRYEQLISERGRIEGEREAALRYRSILSGNEPLCPTCRQPLSLEAADSAIKEHQRVIVSSSETLAAISADLDQIRPLIAEAQALINTPDPVPPTPPSQDLPAGFAEDSIDMSSLMSEISRLEHSRADAKAELAAIQRTDEQRRENAVLSTRLVDGYRTAERAQLAAATMTKLADAICAERIAPMAHELQKRWITLSSDSRLSMDTTGALSLDEGGYVIPYCSLSGGQRTLAQLAVRLLALQMATKCSFFVLDEPLEHLDPRNRRSLATLLVHATHGSSQLRQVLITTYEESVTRRLSSVPYHSDDVEEVSAASTARVVRISAANKADLG